MWGQGEHLCSHTRGAQETYMAWARGLHSPRRDPGGSEHLAALWCVTVGT